MARSTDPRITYPSIAVDRTLYFAYKSAGGRPSPGELLEFAMCAYMNVEAGNEAMYHNILETKRQMQKALQDQAVQRNAVKEEMERARQKEEEARTRRFKLMIRESLLIVDPRSGIFKVPKTIKEAEYNERVFNSVKNRISERYHVGSITDDMIQETWEEMKAEEAENVKE